MDDPLRRGIHRRRRLAQPPARVGREAVLGRLVLAEPQERGVPQDTRLGDFLVAHLRDQLRRNPVVLSASGHLRPRWQFGGREAS